MGRLLKGDIDGEELSFVDEGHVFIDGKQFVSLKRINDIRAEDNLEAELGNYLKRMMNLGALLKRFLNIRYITLLARNMIRLSDV